MPDYTYRRGDKARETEVQQRVAAARNGLTPGTGQPPAAAVKGAVKVGGFPPSRGLYPFAEIASDGGVWKLDPAVFKAKAVSVRAAASSWAAKNGFKAKTVLDGDVVYVQFTRRQP
jgi:hypothetical protein